MGWLFKRKKKDLKPINVMTYGTYDLFHEGHERIIARSYEKSNGGKLYVGVSSDRWNQIKGKKAVQNEKVRLERVQKIPYVTKAFLEDHTKPEQTWLRDYKKYKIDLIIMGSDHEGKLDYLRDKGINIQYLPRTEGISTSMLKKYMGRK